MARELSCECGRCDTCEARERKRVFPDACADDCRGTSRGSAQEGRNAPISFEGLSEAMEAMRLWIERRPRRDRINPMITVQIVVRVRHADRERIKATAKLGGWSMESMMRRTSTAIRGHCGSRVK